MSTVLASAPCTASDFPLFVLVVVLGFFADFSSKKVKSVHYCVKKANPYKEYCVGLSASSCIQISSFCVGCRMYSVGAIHESPF